MRIVLFITLWLIIAVDAAEPPLYKPSSFSESAEDISSNAYGASSLAPKAVGVGEVAPDFSLPVSGGGSFRLSTVAEDGPGAIIFYRGHS